MIRRKQDLSRKAFLYSNCLNKLNKTKSKLG